MNMHDGNIAIVGAAETTTIGLRPNITEIGLHVEAAHNALADAGLSIRDVDGFASAGRTPVFELTDYLGIRPRWLDGTMVGGTSFLFHVRHAAAAIAQGLASVVLITHGESGRTRLGSAPYGFDMTSSAAQFEFQYGAQAPFSSFTVPALRFLKDRGMSVEHLAEVVVAQRKWAEGVPRAMKRTPTTVDEVLAGPPIAYPFTKDMCCLVTDAGGALVVTSAERAHDLPGADRAVYLLGSGESSESQLVSQMEDPGSSRAFRDSSRDAFASAGLGPSDIDHLMGYDAFAHVPLYMLEDLGFVGFGESGAFVVDGHTSPGGSLPMNTNGGGLSYTHSGMYGMFAIQESVRQLRGEAAQQVDGVEVGFVQGVGYYCGASGSLVLSNRQP